MCNNAVYSREFLLFINYREMIPRSLSATSDANIRARIPALRTQSEEYYRADKSRSRTRAVCVLGASLITTRREMARLFLEFYNGDECVRISGRCATVICVCVESRFNRRRHSDRHDVNLTRYALLAPSSLPLYLVCVRARKNLFGNNKFVATNGSLIVEHEKWRARVNVVFRAIALAYKMLLKHR